MSITWTLYNTTQQGEKIRQSWYAASISNSVTIYRETFYFLDQTGQSEIVAKIGEAPTQNLSGKIKCYAEAMYFAPQAAAPLTWTLQDTLDDAQSHTETYTAAVTGGNLYLNLVSYSDPSATPNFQPFLSPANSASKTPQHGEIKTCSATMSRDF
jgi:hypothetical protein